MSLNIIDLIKGQLGPALVSQAASQYGESESNISKAISGLLPAVVGGFANNSDNPAVLDAITGPSSHGLLSNLVGGTTHNSLINNVLNSVFGDKVGGLVNSISSFSGVNNSSANSLLSLVTGATLGSVGKYANDNNLDRSGISKLLSDQKGIVSSLLPAGLSLASLGFGKWFGDHSATTTTATTPVTPTEKVKVTNYDEPKKVDVHRAGNTHVEADRKEGGSIWKWLLPLLLLLLAGYFLWKQCEKEDVDPVTTSTDTINTAPVVADSANTAVTTDKVEKDIDLNGITLKGYENGMEERMITFLKSDGYKNAANDDALKSDWYDFDRVNFEMASATELLPGSEVQLDNLVAILKAYPDAKIKIGGYTDKVGNEANNKKLSKERADYIKKWLADKGVGSQVTETEGYGSEQAEVAADASDAARASDRRMAIRFTK